MQQNESCAFVAVEGTKMGAMAMVVGPEVPLGAAEEVLVASAMDLPGEEGPVEDPAEDSVDD